MGKKATIFPVVWIRTLLNSWSSSMFVMGVNRVIRMFYSEFSMGIIRGPWSFGFFSSIKAGRNMRRISVGVVTIIIMISVRFGIIDSPLSSIVQFPI